MRVLRYMHAGSSPVTCTSRKTRVDTGKPSVYAGFLYVSRTISLTFYELFLLKIKPFSEKYDTIYDTKSPRVKVFSSLFPGTYFTVLYLRCQVFCMESDALLSHHPQKSLYNTHRLWFLRGAGS